MELFEQEKRPVGLTVFSFGGGQDSFAILHKIINDAEFRKKWVQGELLVVMSDTGNEHPATYQFVAKAKVLCEENDIEFHFITSDMGYHSESWPDLKSNMRKNDTLLYKGSMRQACTGNLKVQPIDKFVANWIRTNPRFSPMKVHNGRLVTGTSDSYYWYYNFHGSINLILGIAGGEEKRVKKDSVNMFDPVWKQRVVTKIYPLIEEGMNRQACQEYIRSVGGEVPPPSNCMICFWMNHADLLWLWRNHREEYLEWVELEANKINKHKDREVNNGVWGGKKLIPEILMEAQTKHGHLSDDELNEMKFNHGCVQSKY